jgi:hypothetical protein
MKAMLIMLITWHWYLCSNPTNGRVDFVDGWTKAVTVLYVDVDQSPMKVEEGKNQCHFLAIKGVCRKVEYESFTQAKYKPT